MFTYGAKVLPLMFTYGAKVQTIFYVIFIEAFSIGNNIHVYVCFQVIVCVDGCTN